MGKHILREISKDNFVLLANENNSCVCPFKSSVASRIPPPIEGAKEKIGFTGQNCGNTCPLFEIYNKGDFKESIEASLDFDKVILSCGSGKSIPVTIQHLAEPVKT